VKSVIVICYNINKFTYLLTYLLTKYNYYSASKSTDGFWTHYNIVILIYLETNDL